MTRYFFVNEPYILSVMIKLPKAHYHIYDGLTVDYIAK